MSENTVIPRQSVPKLMNIYQLQVIFNTKYKIFDFL
jgi:hypothetical protein